ncbi:MAG: hypothetical protein KatS3mg105_0985 [Gemmatales bacterium]|nr:MAG: hypothetical protein KatS3mg105_0985 [Gemmatales bacterium]
MPAPATATEFLQLLKKSELVENDCLEEYLRQRSEPLPASAKEAAQDLVRAELITSFQADQLLQGKFRGFRVGKYTVLSPLGAGGMSSVYLAIDKATGQKVAIKVLPKAKAEDSVVLKRFRREGRAIAALEHPNIVRAFEMDQDEKLVFLVMEYVEGISLHEMVKERGPLPIPLACRFIRQAAIGLQYVHDSGMVHRDIKPANLLVDKEGNIKIFDMGLARFLEDKDDILTRGVIGTADYIAPEQTYDSHSVDIRADIYGLGGTFYYLLTGSVPFGEGKVSQKIQWHRSRMPDPIRSFRPEVPSALVMIVDKMMAKNPAERFQQPIEVAEAIDAFLQEMD